MAKLVILGSSGWIPKDGRLTTSLALRTDDDLILFDAGSGLGRLSNGPLRQLLPSSEREINLFLTHLHYDHVTALTFLPALWTNPTVVYVPTVDDSNEGPEVLDRLLADPFFPLRFEELLPAISRRSVGPGELDLGGLRLIARRQLHSSDSLAYRIGDWFAFLTDCCYDPAASDFVRGVGVLVHEAWTLERDDPGGVQACISGHSTAEQAARVARDAGVGELLLTHLPPTDESYYEHMLEEARAIFPNTNLAFDGLERSFG